MEGEKNNAGTVTEAQLLRFVLGTHNRGAAELEASQALRTVVEAVRETRKKGKVSIEIAMEPIPGNVNRLKITIAVTAKPPKQAAQADVYFSTEKGTLQKTDPQQLTWEQTEVFNRKQGVLGAPVSAAPVAEAKTA